MSSLFESDDSIEDTSKYIYVEDLESQALIKKSEDKQRAQMKEKNKERFQYIVSKVNQQSDMAQQHLHRINN